MTDASGILALYQKISSIGFAGVLFLILAGSYYRKWVWGYQLIEQRADFERRLLKSDAERDKWQSIAIRATGIAENGVAIAKQRTGKTVME